MSIYVNSIQQFSVTIASSATSNTVTITSVDTTKAFLLLQGSTKIAGTGTDAVSDTRAELTNSTTVTVTRNTGGTETVTVFGTVVELTAAALNSSIQAGTISLGAATSATATISSVGANAFIAYLGNSNTVASANARAWCTVEITNSTTVTARKGGAIGVNTVGYVVIDVVTGTSFLNSAPQQRSVTLATTNLTDTDTISSVNVNNTLLIWNGSIAALSLDLTEVCYNIQLTNSTTVTLSRGNAAGGTQSRTIAYTVLEFTSGILNFAVQRSTTEITSSPADVTITSVAIAMASVNWCGCLTVINSQIATKASSILLNSTTVRNQNGETSPDTTNSWEVFEFAASGTAIGTAAGRSSATAVGAANFSGVGSATGSASTSFFGASNAAAVGVAAGSSSVFAIAGGAISGAGTATGSSTASGVGGFKQNLIGTATGTSTASATTNVLISSVGTATGTSTAMGVREAAPPEFLDILSFVTNSPIDSIADMNNDPIVELESMTNLLPMKRFITKVPVNSTGLMSSSPVVLLESF